MQVRIEIFPSEEAHPRIKPYSCGAQATELTNKKIIYSLYILIIIIYIFLHKIIIKKNSLPEAEWAVCSLILLHVPLVSFQIMTLVSYEQEANKVPNFGWAQATCQTGPSWLFY